MSNQDWQRDLNPEAVRREAQANVKPRVQLPRVGQNITVVFQSEPRLIPASFSNLGRDFYVADVDDGSSIPKQIVCSKSMRQHLAAMIDRGDMQVVTGARVNISARILPEFLTYDGRVIYNAKVYDVVLLNPIQHGQAAPELEPILHWDIPDRFSEIDPGPLVDYGGDVETE